MVGAGAGSCRASRYRTPNIVPLLPHYKPCTMRPWPFFIAPVLALGIGCAQISLRQTAPDGRETRITGWTLFSSAQSLARLKTTNTDKTQSVGADDLGQRGATNLTGSLEALTRLLQSLR